MLLRYFDDAKVYDIQVPFDARVEYLGDRPAEDGGFLDDRLFVPYEGRYLALPGSALPTLAEHRMYGLRLVSVREAIGRPAAGPC